MRAVEGPRLTTYRDALSCRFNFQRYWTPEAALERSRAIDCVCSVHDEALPLKNPVRLVGLALSGLILAVLIPVGCSASGPTNLGSKERTGDDDPILGGTGGSSGGGSGGQSATGGTILPPGGGTSGNTGEGGACLQDQSQATLVKEPIDIIVVLDNSGSMDEELASVELNINVNFAGILDASGVDYRVILISRHRKEERNPTMPGAEDTSVCVEAPLSGLDACPSPDPIFSARFFQYFTKIESQDSFDVALDTFEPPFVMGFEDRADQAPDGWSAWLRPRAKKVFLEMTDDNEDTSAMAFVTGLQQMAPEHFGDDPGAPTFVFHSIVGVAEKTVPTDPYLPTEPVETDRCPSVTTEGRTYQELSILTGGLRFPLCGFDAYDVVFRRISEDVVTRRQVACEFAIPAPPPGKQLEPDKVAVSYVSGNGSADQDFLQVLDPADCGADAFYLEGNSIVLCPEACAFVQSDGNARVDVLFTCESTIIVR